jgi:single-stranded-DNA-specific exonuclease
MPSQQNIWIEIEADAAVAAGLARELDLPLPLARVLAARGYGDAGAARAFLNPDLREHFSHPFLFPGVRDAAERIWGAVRAGRRIIVFGDFDVDGVVAASTLVTALRRLGARAEAFLPLREPEGYGLTFAALERCLKENAPFDGVLITVDCGINSVDEITRLNSLGIDVIVTDHHEPGAVLPPAAAIVNPRLGASPGAEHLCGAGVALKLVYALVEVGRANGWYDGAPMGGDLFVAVGLATVADVVPLLGENRVLVAGALRHWRRAGVGLQALLQRAVQSGREELAVYTFSFRLGPRLNAAGRMDSAMLAYELLTTGDKDRAAELAARLEGLNAERRNVESRIVAAARAQCGVDGAPGAYSAAAVVAGGGAAEGWHPGVIGIVAARLVELAGVPAAVVAFDADGTGRGSVRAGAGYHAIEALQEASDALHGFGGHARAAGFSLKAGCLEAFKERFSAACARQQQQMDASVSQVRLDGWLTADDISMEFLEAQQRLSPFGEGNPAPRWGLRGVGLENVRAIGQGGEHLSLTIRLPDGDTARAVWFRHGHLAQPLQAAGKGTPHDVLFALTQSDFGGEPTPEIRVIAVNETL